MKNVIFDVDDTLYNLMEPFEKAHKELMAACTDADCEELFEASRTYSDEAFCMSREGKISEDEEFAYRVQKTYADVGVEAVSYTHLNRSRQSKVMYMDMSLTMKKVH